METLIDGIGEVTESEECAKKVSAVREAYDGLSNEQQAKVYNREILFAAEEIINSNANSPEVTAAIESIQAFLDGFSGFTMENRLTLQAQIASVDNIVANVPTSRLNSVTNYEEYLEAKNSFMVIDELRDGTVAELKAKFTWIGAGYNSINNGITAPAVASALYTL